MLHGFVSSLTKMADALAYPIQHCVRAMTLGRNILLSSHQSSNEVFGDKKTCLTLKNVDANGRNPVSATQNAVVKS